MKIDDVTFLIPVRIDSLERLENLVAVVGFLDREFETQIKVLEASSYCNDFLSILLKDKAEIVFREDYDPVFHRTRYINQLVQISDTPIISVWDSDVIIDHSQIYESVRLIREGMADFVYPYANNFLDTSNIVRELYLKGKQVSTLKQFQNKMKRLYGPEPVGGAFLANRKSYISSGMENEKFYGWGREDGDRLIRWETTGYTHARVEGNLYHLTHPRGLNSTFHSKKQDNRKWHEIQSTKSLSKEELCSMLSKEPLSGRH